MKRERAALLSTLLVLVRCTTAEPNSRAPIVEATLSAVEPAPRLTAHDEPTQPPDRNEEPKAPMTAAQLKAYLADKTAILTPEAYESLLLGLAFCSVDEDGIDPECEHREDFVEGTARKRQSEASDPRVLHSICLRHLRHAKAAVRYEAALLAEYGAVGRGAAAGGEKRYVDAARAETEPVILARMVHHSGTIARESALMRELLVGLIAHPDARVREETVQRLGQVDVAKNVDGYYELVLAKVDTDSDDEVRSQACRVLSSTENPAAVAVYKKYLESSNTPDELRAGCFEGLVTSWVDWIYPKQPSKEGYELTMKLLEKTPRTEKMPPWRGMSMLGLARSEHLDHQKDGKAWYAAAKAFYDKGRLAKALKAVALDEKASHATRATALGALEGLGEQNLLGSIVPKLEAQKGPDAKRLSDTAARYSKKKK